MPRKKRKRFLLHEEDSYTMSSSWAGYVYVGLGKDGDVEVWSYVEGSFGKDERACGADPNRRPADKRLD